MAPATDPPPSKLARQSAYLASALCTAAGLIVLSGWAAGVPALTRVLSGAEAMRANTALGFVLVGAGLWGALRGGRLAQGGRWLAGVAIGIAGLTLVEHVSGVTLGIDELLFVDPTTAAPPGRMTPMMAANFIAAGAGVISLASPTAWPTQLAAAIVGVTSLVNFAGYLYGAPAPHSVGAHVVLPIHTTLTFLALAIGLVFARPHDGLALLLARPSAGGRLARRLLPAAVLVPLLVGWLRLVGQRSGLYDIAFGLALFSVVQASIFVALTIATARWIDGGDRRQRQIEIELERADRVSRDRAGFLAAIVDSSDDAIVGTGLDGTIRSWNRGAERLYGYRPDEADGRNIAMLAPPDRLHEVSDKLERVKQGASLHQVETVRVRNDGTAIPVSLTVSPIMDADRRIIGASMLTRDITDRKRAEGALRAASQFNQQIVRSVGEGIAVYDRNLRYILFNPAMERLVGLSARDVVGAHPAELWSGWEASATHAILARALAGEHIPREAVAPDGSFDPAIRWVDDEHVPLQTEAGDIIGVIATVRDVTDRKRHEDEIERLNRLYAALSHVNQTIVRARTRGELLEHVCKALVEQGGFRSSWVARHDAERRLLVAEAWWGDHPELLSALQAPTDAAERGPGPAAMAFRQRQPYVCNDFLHDPVTLMVRDEATQLGVRSSASFPIRLQNEVCGTLTVYSDEVGFFRDKEAALLEEAATDVSFALDNLQSEAERRHAEDALRASEERTAFALASAHMGVWEADLATTRVTISDSVARLFGASAADLATLVSVDARVHADDRVRFVAVRERAIRDGVEFSEEFRVIWPDGSVHWLYAAGFVARRRSTTLVGVTMDITERRSLEAQLRQAQKMEAVGQLAGGVAHDFNNLLTAILGYSRFLADAITDPAQQRDVAEIVKAGERAAGLTRQLLAFSRRQTLEAKRLDLNVIVREIVPMLRRLIGEHIELVTTLSDPLEAVRADRGQIEQVIMNLVVNARDAMSVGGRIRIETSTAVLDAAYVIRHAPVRPGTYAMLAVSDTGQGMSEEVQARAFEPFFTTKEAGKGTGLGLATVYGIVKQSGGYVWVYSEVGRGTTFKVYLPRDRGPETDAPADPAKAEAASRGETVLVVEDEDSVRFLAQMILERAGYRVFAAPGPREAEAIFEAHAGEIAALVTDVIMPGGTGLDLYRRLSVHHLNLRVLFMSGYTGDAVMDQANVPPGGAFLQKPFAAEGLLRKLREVLDR